MKRLYNLMSGTQFIRVPLTKFNAHGYTISVAAKGMADISDVEYLAISPVSDKIWRVEHIDDATPDTTEEILSLIVASGSHTHDNKLVLDANTESFTSALKTSYDAEIVSPVTRLLYTDKNRTDTYLEDGSAEKPFKTLAAALSRAEQDTDRASVPYSILLSSGTYAEEINLNGRGFFSLTFAAQGRVAIVPVAGNAVTADTGVSSLQDLHFYGIEFGKPIVITGDGTANQFKNVNFRDCSFAGLADVALTCMNSVALWDIYCEKAVTLSNVNYLAITGGQIQGVFSMGMDSANTAPSSGVEGGANLFNLRANDIALTVAGAGALWSMFTYNCVFGKSLGEYTIPASCSLALHNSLFRGKWTNNGGMSLRNSQMMDHPVLGTAPTFTANRSSYTAYTPTTPTNWNGSPTNVNDAIDRLAAAIYALNGNIAII